MEAIKVLLRPPVNALLRRLGYRLTRTDKPVLDQRIPAEQPEPTVAYVENADRGPVNWEAKKARIERGEPFEWPDVANLNRTVAAFLGSGHNVAEIGGGTGLFAHESAATFGCKVVTSDPDAGAIAWARENRSHPHITHLNRLLTPRDGPFDVVISIDVIEHVTDFHGFLSGCASLADRAIITTPDRCRDPQTSHHGPPNYESHVREWNAGEFYWLLRSFYRRVDLFGVFDHARVGCIPITISDRCHALIADCSDPIRTQGDAYHKVSQ